MFLHLLRIGRRSFQASGRRRGGPGDPSKRWGAKPPTFGKGLRGPRGRPDPQNGPFPTLKQLSITWVPEGSLAGFFWRHEVALSLVCGADFGCNRHCRTSPVVLEGSKFGRKSTENRPDNFRPDCLQVPRLPPKTQGLVDAYLLTPTLDFCSFYAFL